MPLSSMTGFARVDGALGNVRWHWELRSVNGKGLDVRFRLPAGMDGMEPQLRAEFARQLKRGHCQVNLTLDRQSELSSLKVNREALETVLAAVADIQHRIETAPPRPEAILALKGVLETGDNGEASEEEKEALEKAILASFLNGLSAFVAARAQEGAKLEAILRSQVDEIERLTHRAASIPAAMPEAIKDRLTAQLLELTNNISALPEDRLAQEAALLATKADIREELDRLLAHVVQARELLDSGEPVGRRLDFLTQEFNREANTLCSKASDVSLTRVGLDLKAVIDQLREQIQNVE